MIVTCVLGGTTLKNTMVLLKREIVLKLTEEFLMFHKPAHKQIGSISPGQIKNDITLSDYIERKQNSFNRYPYMKHSTAEPILETPKKKLTFEEWWKKQMPMYEDKPFEYMVDAAEAAWKAAQENV